LPLYGPLASPLPSLPLARASTPLPWPAVNGGRDEARATAPRTAPRTAAIVAIVRLHRRNAPYLAESTRQQHRPRYRKRIAHAKERGSGGLWHSRSRYANLIAN